MIGYLLIVEDGADFVHLGGGGQKENQEKTPQYT